MRLDWESKEARKATIGITQTLKKDILYEWNEEFYLTKEYTDLQIIILQRKNQKELDVNSFVIVKFDKVNGKKPTVGETVYVRINKKEELVYGRNPFGKYEEDLKVRWRRLRPLIQKLTPVETVDFKIRIDERFEFVMSDPSMVYSVFRRMDASEYFDLVILETPKGIKTSTKHSSVWSINHKDGRLVCRVKPYTGRFQHNTWELGMAKKEKEEAINDAEIFLKKKELGLFTDEHTEQYLQNKKISLIRDRKVSYDQRVRFSHEGKRYAISGLRFNQQIPYDSEVEVEFVGKVYRVTYITPFD